MRGTAFASPRLPHIVKVFISSHGAFAQGAVFNRLEKSFFPGWLQARFDQISHLVEHNTDLGDSNLRAIDSISGETRAGSD
jgi:hypothetical protein